MRLLLQLTMVLCVVITSNAQVEKFYPADTTMPNRFGDATEVNDSWLFISESGDGWISYFAGSGKVLVYHRDRGQSFVHVQTLKPDEITLPGTFGHDLSLLDSILVVGDVEPVQTGGEGVHTYHLRQGTWELVDAFTAANSDTGDWFGYHVELVQNRLVVSAPNRSDMQYLGGAVYVFEASGNGWAQRQYIQPAFIDSLDFFGSSFAVQDSLLIIPGHASATINHDTPYVCIYTFKNGQYQLTQRILHPSDTTGYSAFGRTALSGPYLFVTAVGDTIGYGRHGSVYVYRLINGQYQFQQQLIGQGAGGIYEFGFWLDAYDDILLVSSRDSAGSALKGAIYQYSRSANIWTLDTIYPSLATPAHYFGDWEALNLYQNNLSVGALASSGSGRAYFWELCGLRKAWPVEGDTFCAGEEAVLKAGCPSDSVIWSTAQGVKHTGQYYSFTTTATVNVFADIYTNKQYVGRDTVRITVQPAPKAQFSVPVKICSGEPVTFTNASQGGAGATYAWDIDGDGTTDTLKAGSWQYTYAYGHDTTITARLIVTNTNGCADTIYRTFTVEVCTGIEDGLKGDIEIFPNPTEGWIYVQGVWSGPVELSAYDMVGRKAGAWSLTGSKAVDLSLPAGMYLLQLTDEEGGRQQWKLSVVE